MEGEKKLEWGQKRREQRRSVLELHPQARRVLFGTREGLHVSKSLRISGDGRKKGATRGKRRGKRDAGDLGLRKLI